MRRFGTLRNYADGEKLFETGEPALGMFVVLAGNVAIMQHDGMGHMAPVADQGGRDRFPRRGRAALQPRDVLVDGTAEGDVVKLLADPAMHGLRSLLVADADLGERIMRALILRRVNLIQSGVGGPALVGAADMADIIRLEGFLSRNGWPHHLLDPATDHEASDLVAHYASEAGGLPLVVCPDGAVLHNPTEAVLARQLGMIARPRQEGLCL